MIKDMRHKLFMTMCCLVSVSLASCSDWREIESVNIDVKRPCDQAPELWSRYTAALRSYKQTEHYILYARLENSPSPQAGEKNYMRCLPDSLDIVSLTNADNFSAKDSEDLAVMSEKGIKVLYQIDFASRVGELSDATKLGAYLDKVISSVKELGLDGFSFTGTARTDDSKTAELSRMMVERLSAAKSDGQILAFEGNPRFISKDDITKIDYFVLDTEQTLNAQEIRFQVLEAVESLGIPSAKILLAVQADGTVTDEDKVENPALEEMADRVIAFGPLAGLAIYNMDTDYYHTGSNYSASRAVIQILNPSK